MNHEGPQTAVMHDVAIIGLGPVGAVLANLLALRGLSVLVLERDAEIYRLPRAIAIDAECMRVLQTVGIADALAPQLVIGTGMRFVNADGELLMDWRRPPGISAQGWHSSYRFHQPSLEAALRDKLGNHARVAVLKRHEVFAIEDLGDRVRLRHEDLSRGRLDQSEARWVVGCDGARSTVRRFMGTELEDLNSHERWLVVDVILKRERPDLGDDSIQYCDPARPATYVRGTGMRRRWELMLMPGEDPTEMTRPEVLWRLLARWVTPQEAQLERPACYTFHSVVAAGWRRGRLLIAGDAAHQTPPFLGQGMCAGIRDAANLAWKLADVVHGADAAQLDTYEQERSPHIRAFVETAVRVGKLIQTTDREAAARRDADMLNAPVRFSTPQPRLGPGLHEAREYGGQLAEQPRLLDGHRLDDRVGYRHVLVANPSVTPILPAHDPALAIVQETGGECAAMLERLQASAVLIRPDRYIAAIARTPQEIPPMLARWVPDRLSAERRSTPGL